MAHEIDFSNGRANMAYVGAQPWHGLGQRLTHDAPLETWLTEAGMNWAVRDTPAYFVDEEMCVRDVPERRVLYRSDTKVALGMVGSGYNVVQPKEVLEFFRDLVAEHGYVLETAGCLFGGRKFWAMARIGAEAKVGGIDPVVPYLLLATSCDGSLATCAHLTSVRTVCNNTLRQAIGEGGARARVRVVHSAVFDPQTTKVQLGVAGEAWERFLQNINTLASIKLSRDAAIDAVAAELKAEWLDAETGEPMTQAAILESSLLLRRVMALYDGSGRGSSLSTARNTAWGLLNAVTQYIDHESGAKAGAKAADRSKAFERSQLTDRAAFKVGVANRLLELA